MPQRVEFIIPEEEAKIEKEVDLINLIGDKSNSVGGQIFWYPFQGRGEATKDLWEELDELENLMQIWKTNFGRKGICKVIPCDDKKRRRK